MRYLLIKKTPNDISVTSYHSEHKMARAICESFLTTIDYEYDASIEFQNAAHTFKQAYNKKDYLCALNSLHNLFDFEEMGIFYISEDHKKVSRSLCGKFKVMD